jgi:hypothetical protein
MCSADRPRPATTSIYNPINEYSHCPFTGRFWGQQTRLPASDAQDVATCPASSKFQRSARVQQTCPTLHWPLHLMSNRRSPVSTKNYHPLNRRVRRKGNRRSSASDAAQRLCRLYALLKPPPTDADATRLS